MGLNIDNLVKAADGAFYVSPARLCLTAGGELCDCDDVDARTLLVGEGGQLPVAVARKHGLISEAAEAAPKALKPAGNKGRKGTEDKGE